jgi:hypothetical protein
MSGDDDDKPTVVLDLNALKKQKIKQEEDLANIGQELEFAVGPDEGPQSSAPKQVTQKSHFKVILFDFQSDFFKKAKSHFPIGFDYQIATTLQDLNKFLGEKLFQIVVFNYDVNPKAINQLTAQIKQKFPHTKTVIMAKNISPEKARMHAKTPSGANGYYQFPLETKKIEAEFLKIHQTEKKKAG